MEERSSDAATDLAFAGIEKQAKMVRGGEVTPSELLDLYLERIERIDPDLNAFAKLLHERAREDAARVEQRLADGEGDAMPMAGVPIGVKDTEDVAGEITAWGSAAFDQPAASDGEMIRRLRDAGAIIVGKTTLPELAICGFTETKTYGVTRNPWDTSRTTGGSSGGSAAAVAAGLVAAATASDGAGSIRIPAAFNGLFGLKPQRNRISLAPFREHWHGLSVIGSLTRSVADSALWLDVCHGPVPGGPPSPPVPEHSFLNAARSPAPKLRIAYSTKPLRALAPPTLTDEIEGAVDGAAKLLAGLGHAVERRDPRWGLIGTNTVPRYLRGVSEQFALAQHPENFEQRTKGFDKLGRRIPLRELRRARNAEARDTRRVLTSVFDEADVLVMPVTGEPAFEVERWKGKGAFHTLMGMSRAYPYCLAWNHIGNPAASVPFGFTPAGLPLAIQLVGRPNDEATLLALAAQIEEAQPWADRRPKLAA
jgi:amidase